MAIMLEEPKNLTRPQTIKAIKIWLERKRGHSEYHCPFIDYFRDRYGELSGRYNFSVFCWTHCHKYGFRKAIIKNNCPCNLYPLTYVRKRARIILERLRNK